MTMPAVSVVLPTRNGGAQLVELLDRLAAQQLSPRAELVVVDSGSTDGTAERLRARADRFLSLEPAEFGHGRTRNLALAACSGRVAILLVQDALPVGERFVATLAEAVPAGGPVAGAFARQLPRPDAGSPERRQLARWVASGAEPRVASVDGAGEWDRLSPAERLDRAAFDDVASAVDLDWWRRIPFPDVPIAEDLCWAKRVLLAGGSLAFVPTAEVVHSHRRSPGEEFRRTRALHRVLAAEFGLVAIPDRPSLVRSVVSTLVAHAKLPAPSAGDRARALALAIAWPAGQYAGARDARRTRGDS